ncbi:ammonium transporter [Novosphingobium mangrovi (ex Hu et al. 2023)]|uniref:Ammonium transporter n=1 Tax=Novosphingobium mangrovi (ex Hu et al. 2023) TaxID=2930094 RepID=A0ABT0AAA9_9SPHN|nr:ammonium transporter [Novosphingobium mangrovi (ex Hu et al. 2023)]MCJ1960133.1 ammonium transporter [Novosphingobium mangrovi (ex Hu et al. 2023)]
MNGMGRADGQIGKAGHRLALSACSLLFASISSPACAQSGALDLADTGDTAWILAASVLAFAATLPGFVLFACGQARGRNQITTLYQGMGAVLASTLAWAIAGYTLAFGHATGGWLGAGNAWMLREFGNLRAGSSIPESGFALFQSTSALLPVAILVAFRSGRMNTAWLMLFAPLWSLVAYAPLAHAIWGGGWISEKFLPIDWNGGIVIGVGVGVSGLVLALMGADREPAPSPLSPLGLLLALLGATLFLVGRIAASGGQALTGNDDAAAAMLATLLGAAAGTMTWLLLGRATNCPPGPLSLARGILCGLACIAPAAGYVSPGGAIVIGAFGTTVSYSLARTLQARTRLGDAGVLASVFAGGGACGSLLVVPFIQPALGGTGHPSGTSLIDQLIGQAGTLALATIWVAATTLVLATMVSLVRPMRPAQECVDQGLDIATPEGF